MVGPICAPQKSVNYLKSADVNCLWIFFVDFAPGCLCLLTALKSWRRLRGTYERGLGSDTSQYTSKCEPGIAIRCIFRDDFLLVKSSFSSPSLLCSLAISSLLGGTEDIVYPWQRICGHILFTGNVSDIRRKLRYDIHLIVLPRWALSLSLYKCIDKRFVIIVKCRPSNVYL